MAKRFLVHSFTGAPVSGSGHEVQECSIGEFEEVWMPCLLPSDYNTVMQMAIADTRKIETIKHWEFGHIVPSKGERRLIIHRIE